MPRKLELPGGVVLFEQTELEAADAIRAARDVAGRARREEAEELADFVAAKASTPAPDEATSPTPDDVPSRPRWRWLSQA